MVAGGSGRRFGQLKQFAPLGGRLVLEWAVEACRPHSAGVVLVLPAGAPLPDTDTPQHGADVVVEGGASRAASVGRGLAAVPEEADVVLVHDAARPFAPAAVFEAVLGALDEGGVDGAVPGVPVHDTIKQVDTSQTITATLDRTTLVAVQTPQGFRATALRLAHAAGGTDGATDDAVLVEAAGGRVRVVPGDPGNLKITTPEDLATAEGLLGHPSGGRRTVRIGQGIDVHRFADDPRRPLVLGGVVIEGARGLAGHSDADAVCHALADAVLGAVGLGDLGRHFPDTDPEWEGADSVALLTEVVRMAAGEGYRCANADCTVVAESPRLAPHTPAMVERLGTVLGAPVSVKATRAEGLGALGRAEGIACLAVVLLEPR